MKSSVKVGAKACAWNLEEEQPEGGAQTMPIVNRSQGECNQSGMVRGTRRWRWHRAGRFFGVGSSKRVIGNCARSWMIVFLVIFTSGKVWRS